MADVVSITPAELLRQFYEMIGAYMDGRIKDVALGDLDLHWLVIRPLIPDGPNRDYAQQAFDLVRNGVVQFMPTVFTGIRASAQPLESPVSEWAGYDSLMFLGELRRRATRKKHTKLLERLAKAPAAEKVDILRRAERHARLHAGLPLTGPVDWQAVGISWSFILKLIFAIISLFFL